MAQKKDELESFVREALASGIPRTDIAQALRQAGWDAERTDAALAAFSDIAFPLPVPRPVPSISAREVFFYLVLFAALATFAYSLATMLFGIIDKLLPDAAERPSFAGIRDRGIRWSIARIVVAFPLFVLMSYCIDRAIQRGRFAYTSAVRLWLTYLAMFVAVSVLMGDLITLVAYLLDGDTTLRFLLKATTVALIALAVLAYYLNGLRRAEGGR